MPSSYTIGKHYEALIKRLVESGRYASASEVIRDGMRLLEEKEQLRETKLRDIQTLIQEGIDSGDAGALDMEDIIAEAKRRKAKKDAA
ncbi:MAG TPA: type II toxin-antitoxin system ParD family antitoxin [Devosia sp.]